MLVLKVDDGDYVMIGEDIKVRFYKVGSLFKLSIDAPRDVRIRRQSVYERENPDYADDFARPKQKERTIAR